jgi:hypothetical protein
LSTISVNKMFILFLMWKVVLNLLVVEKMTANISQSDHYLSSNIQIHSYIPFQLQLVLPLLHSFVVIVFVVVSEWQKENFLELYSDSPMIQFRSPVTSSDSKSIR